MHKTAYISLLILGIISAIPLKADHLDSLQSHMDSLEVLHQKLAASGDMEGAAKALHLYDELAFKWQSRFDSTQVQEMKKKYQLDISAAKIETEALRLKNQITIIFMSLGAGLIVFLVLLVLRKRVQNRARIAEMRFEEEQLKIRAETQLQELKLTQIEQEKEQLSEILALKQQRLSTQMLQLLNKNQLLLSLQEKTKQWESQPHYWQDLQSELQAHINSEEDWAAFLQQSEQLYPAFFSQLRAINPSLTKQDFRLAILLRVQLSSKEIAALLGLTTDSVKTARYRLSKKLAVKSGQKLQDFLMEKG